MIKKIDGLVIFIWTYIIVSMPPFFILYFIGVSSPESNTFSTFVKTTPELTTILIATITLSLIGSWLGIVRGKMSYGAILKVFTAEILYFVAFSFLLAVVLWRFFSFFSEFGYLGLIMMFIFIIFYLPIMFGYLDSLDFNEVKRYIIQPTERPLLPSIENILYGLAVFLVIHISVFTLDARVKTYNKQETILSRYPQIMNREPKIVYYGTKVILTGRRFGWNEDGTAKLKQYMGQTAATDLWTDTKIVFTIPLHWKEGNVDVWIENFIESEDGKLMKTKSNKVSFILISRDGAWDEEDDAYFEQLKTLNKETLLINGYSAK